VVREIKETSPSNIETIIYKITTFPLRRRRWWRFLFDIAGK